MPYQEAIVAEVLNVAGAAAPFNYLRVETESTNNEGEIVFRPLASITYDPKSGNRYVIQYTLKRADAAIWLVLVDSFGETKKRITTGEHRIVFRSEMDAPTDRAAIINYIYTKVEIDMSKRVTKQEISGSPGAIIAGRDVTSRQVNAFNRDSYNAIKDRHGEEVANAFGKVGQAIGKSKSPKARKAFLDLSKEAGKAKPNKTKMKSYWNDLVKLTPAVAKIGTGIAKITGLFSSAAT
jgi:hypothetical protein